MELFGKYNHLLTFTGYGLIFINWGFLAKGIREIAAEQKNAATIVHEIVSTKIFLWLISSIVILGLIALLYQGPDVLLLVGLALLANLGQAVNLDFYFYATKNTIIPSVAKLSGQILFLLLLLGFIKSSEDIYYLFFFLLLFQFLEAFINFIYFKKQVQIYKVVLSYRKSFAVLKNNFYLGLGAKTSFLTFSIPIILIPLFYDNKALGAYMLAYKIFLFMTGIFSIGTLVISPYVVQYIKERKANIYQLFSFTLLAFIFTGFLGGALIYYFHEDFIAYFFQEEFMSSSKYFFPFMCILVPIWGAYTCLIIFINNLLLDRLYSGVSLIQLTLIAIVTPLLLNYELILYTIYLVAFSTLISAVIYFKIIYSRLRTIIN
jgi:O-antigen/teichoic acid export membrane protein